jgi:hypothetical protein
MADINVTINPAPSVSAQVSAAPEVDVTIGDGIPKHAVTHAPGGSDSLEAYYATTGSLAYVSGLTTGIGNTGYLTGYVSKSETGDFYPASNPSGFITGVDLSSYATQSYVTGVSGYLQNQVTNLANSTGSYVTGSVVRPSETGNFITSSQTGQFVSTGSTGVFVTGSVVRPSQTGAFLTTGAADARYALSSATGNFITASQTGVFASQTYVNNVSGHLQTQVTAINNQTGNFALKSQTGSFITTSQTGQFVGTSQTGYYTGIFYPYNSNPLGYVQGAVVRPSQTGAFLTTGAGDSRYFQQGSNLLVYTTGNQLISGNKNFVNNINVGTPNGIVGGSGNATIGFGNYISGDNSVCIGYANNNYNVNDTILIGYANEALSGLYYPPNDPENPILLDPSRFGFALGNRALIAHSGAGIISATDPGGPSNEKVLTSGVGTLVIVSSYGTFIRGDAFFDTRPTFNGTGFLLSGEGGSANTGELTGAFYPLNSNPNGYVTGSVVRPSETGSFITQSQTGAFYPASNPSGFITGVDLSNYVTGDVVRPSETGSFITISQTGQFVGDSETGIFYPASNPSGFITGVDLSAYVTGDVVRPNETGAFLTTGAGDNRYALQSNTGIFVTTGQTGNFVTGSVVRPSETGNFITTAQTGQFVGDSETGAFLTTGAADARYALQSNTGNFITQSQTGQFYAASNPSGFITGVDLSSYATTSYVTGVSGDLQNKINIASGYAVTGYNDSITGIEVTGNLTKTINLFQRDGGVLSASFSDVSGSGGALIENAVYTTGNQNISGEKRFYNETFFESGVHLSGKITFNTEFLPQVLDGEASWNNEYGTVQIGMNNGDVLNPVGFKSFYRVKASGNITKGKVVMAVGSVGNSEFIIAQEAANIGPSGELIMGVAAENITADSFGDVVSFGPVKGVDTSSFNSGAILYFDPASTGGLTQIAPSAPNAKVTVAFNINSSVNGTVFIRVSHGSRFGETDSNVKFTALKDNDFVSYSIASGFWYNKTLTTGDVSGINNYVLKSETGSFITTSQTGQFVGDSETGAFLTTGAADGRYALQSQTGDFITTAQTGQFVGDSETGNFITTSQTGAFYPASNPSGFITGVDLSAYVTGAVVRPSETGAFLTTGAADGRYALQSATGNFITTSQTGAFAAAANTGAFLTTGAADNRYALQSATGNFINTSQTGAFAAAANTGAFLTTGAADGRYYGLANGQSISGYAITGYNDAITGMSVTGDSTKTITLFQRDGTNVSANFTDNGGSVSNVVFTTGDQTISGIKTFTGTIVAVSGIIGSTNAVNTANNSSVIAGSTNRITNGGLSAILAGSANVITGSSPANLRSAIIGGNSSTITSAADSIILGGFSNEISGNSYSVIAGGLNNEIKNASSSFAVGTTNIIENTSSSVSAFGYGNLINSSNNCSAFGSTNTISGTSVAHAFGYGTKADRYGIKTFGSDYFSERGDAQNFERTLYANSQNGEVKTLSSDAETVIPYFFNLFYNQSSKIMLATIKVLGVDEDANVSQYMRKAVISVGSTGLQQIKHIESIGTDTEDAGKIFFSTNDANLNTGDFASTFCIFGSGLAGNQTRWMAHVNAIEVNIPPSYP